MSNPQYIFILFSFLQCWFSTISATCWLKNQTDRNANLPSELYLPCHQKSATASMCCRQPDVADTCQNNGLCKDASGDLWRESCTDLTWKSPNCLNLCVDGIDSNGPRANQDVRITQCQGDNSIFCCGGNIPDSYCCENGFRIQQGQALAANATASSSTMTSPTATVGTTSTASTSTGTASPLALTSTGSPSTSPTPIPTPHSNTGAIVGGVLGGIAAIAIIIGASWFLFARRRRRAAGSLTSENLPGQTPTTQHHKEFSRYNEMSAVGAGKYVDNVDGIERIEIDGHTMPSELEGHKAQMKPRELE